jgi:malate dehydrogenase (oxaloacetate-decarboxylating)(NADP+)
VTSTLKENALYYHRYPKPGKIRITPTKPLTTQQDLALAYSPGVAAASEWIHEDPAAVSEVTARGNLVAVISNGTAVLGLGNIGPLAAKPVMEGKAVLFKKFADIDVFDIEIDEADPDKLVDIIAALEPTFGGINLEDIKAPECFVVESKLKSRLSIPVFHDDQHGTAIITAAAVRNALQIVGKPIEDRAPGRFGRGCSRHRLPGSAGHSRSAKRAHRGRDREGVVYAGRETDMDERKAQICRRYRAALAREADARARTFSSVFRPEACSSRRDGGQHGGITDHPGAGQPGAGNPARTRPARYGPMPSSPQVARTIRTRSITCSAFPTFSAARWTSAPVASTRR